MGRRSGCAGRKMKRRICRGCKGEGVQKNVPKRWGSGWRWAPCGCVRKAGVRLRMSEICCRTGSPAWVVWLHLEGSAGTRPSWVSTALVPAGTPAAGVGGWVNWGRVRECHRGECFEVWSTDWEVQGHKVPELGMPSDSQRGQCGTPCRPGLGTSSPRTQTLPAPRPHSSRFPVCRCQCRPSRCTRVHLHSRP